MGEAAGNGVIAEAFRDGVEGAVEAGAARAVSGGGIEEVELGGIGASGAALDASQEIPQRR
jgi:hypothetical protein